MIPSAPPIVVPGTRWSALCVVVVHWNMGSFTMFGRCAMNGTSWWLWHYPKGYGGPVFTDRGPYHDRPDVYDWEPVSAVSIAKMSNPPEAMFRA